VKVEINGRLVDTDELQAELELYKQIANDALALHDQMFEAIECVRLFMNWPTRPRMKEGEFGVELAITNIISRLQESFKPLYGTHGMPPCKECNLGLGLHIPGCSRRKYLERVLSGGEEEAPSGEVRGVSSGDDEGRMSLGGTDPS
jgi:hypothetical protein